MRENVVIIMADQLRYDVLGRGFTPNIDSIREGGVDFTRAYCACPLCVPARGAFFTGKWPNVNGSLINPWLASDSYYGSVHEGIDNLYRMMEKDWCSIHSGKQHLFTEGGKLEDVDKDTIWASRKRSQSAGWSTFQDSCSRDERRCLYQSDTLFECEYRLLSRG